MNDIVVIRGGGDIATGVIQKLYRCGFKVVILEISKPSTIRSNVALSSAVYLKSFQVEDLKAQLVNSIEEIEGCFDLGIIPVLIDEQAQCLKQLKPLVVVDAIIAKKNLGTTIDMALITIALGPGFNAGVDVDVVVETMRGHHLGKLYFNGYAIPNTGTPGEIGGQSLLRVIHSRNSGIVKPLVEIGTIVNEGQPLLTIEEEVYLAPFKGLIRGMIHEGFKVKAGFKIADIDPRIDVIYDEISDKARSIGGAVLEAILIKKREIENE
ncbi:MAG: selenium-dependent molybdenum cofactor biosynthesis protein YqeB [Bacilli bacterium]